MKRTERFTSLADVAVEKRRLDAVRQQHQQRLQRHWRALQDHEVRGHLIRDAAGDALRSWGPLRLLSSVFGDGSVGGAFGAALRTRGGLGKRALWFGLSMALPGLLKRAGSLNLRKLMSELKLSYGRIKDYMRARQEDHPSDEDADDDDDRTTTTRGPHATG